MSPSPEMLEKQNHQTKKDNVQHSFLITQIQMEEFDFAMEKIKEATGMTEMDDIITAFLESEEKNFSLFNYVAHELNGEIDQLERLTVTVKKEIDNAKAG